MVLWTWRSLPWSRNPLIRPSDRVLAAIAMVAVVCCVAAVPIAVVAGSARYDAAARRLRTEEAARSVVTATVAADARYVRTARRAEAAVRWRWDGQVRSTAARVPAAAVRGDRLEIWVDDDGALTDSPPSSGIAAWLGIGSALAILVTVFLGAAALVESARWIASRRRDAQWDIAWRHIAESGHDE
ncbi:hypothetical protein [Nocardia sp. BMG51109]|uniref:Rv1733c family protein n=1 Tax=Nocardia sp. BMG51109 TaxID=1056816 RepID=UPI0004651A89|nr:hypothetical protein [Nocardia sp. BMG51109]